MDKIIIDSLEQSSDAVHSNGTKSAISSLRSILGPILIAIGAAASPAKATGGPVNYTPDPVIAFGAGNSGLSAIPTELYSTAGTSMGTVLASLTSSFENVASNGYDFIIKNLLDADGNFTDAGIDFDTSIYSGLDADGNDVYTLSNVKGDSMTFLVNSVGDVVVYSNDSIRFELIPASVVSEPGTIALLTAGLFGVFASLKRRNAKLV